MSEPPDRSRAENMERVSGLARGQKGDKGDKGEQGSLSPKLRRSLVYLFGVAAGLALVALFAVFHGQAADRAAQQRQGQLVEAKLCATLGKLAALKPPPGSPAANPSRAFEQQLHATLDQLGPDLGCR